LFKETAVVTTPDQRRYIDDLLVQGNLGLSLVGPATTQGGASAYPQLALNALRKGFVKSGMAASGADKRLDATIGALTSGQFQPNEIRTLEDRALDKIDWDDAKAMSGVTEGSPVVLTAPQKAIVDKLMGQIGSDPLGQRAQAAYGRAVANGQVRVR
jgi:hypothetical protein